MLRTIPFYQCLIGKGTTAEVLLYGLIEVLAYEKGYCYASNKYLAEQLGIKESSLPVLLSNIKKKRWIDSKFDENGKRQSLIPCLFFSDEGLMCIKGGFNEDLRGGLMCIKQIIKKDNIVDNNNFNNKDKSLLLKGETPNCEVVENSQKFGNEQINEAFAIWEDCFGIPQKNNAANRRAAYNLMRAKDKGPEWIKNSLKILAVAQRTRFVRKEVSGISNYSDLQRNWEYLWQWGKAYAEGKAKATISDKI